MDELSIFFDNPQALFYPGQNVKGCLRLSLSREKRMRGIELLFKGQAKVKWSEGSGDNEETYSAKEKYFKTSIFVLGGSDGVLTVQPGQYVYPFDLMLPSALPCSFEGRHGHVRYTVRGIIVHPWRLNHVCKAAFTVLQHLDLNQEPHLLEPLQEAAEKRLFCSSRSVSIVATVQSSGFVPGQTCKVTIEVDNRTNKSVPVKCYLVQRNVFKDDSKRPRTTKNKVDIYEKAIGVVEEYKSRTWTTDMEIPILPPSYLKHCSLIDISYNLTVKGVVSGLHRDAVVKLPIVIGTIPFRNYFSFITPPAAAVPPNAPFGAEQREGSSTPHNPYLNYPELPPPSFEESVTGKADIREDDNQYVQGDMNFAPRYPVYQFK